MSFEYAWVFDDSVQKANNDNLMYIRRCVKQEYAELLNDVRDFEPVGRNFVDKIVRKKVRMVYKNEPLRELTGGVAFRNVAFASIMPYMTALMKDVARITETYGSSYWSFEHGVVSPCFVWHGEGFSVVRKEQEVGKGDRNIFDWLYMDGGEARQFVNGKEIFVGRSTLIEIAYEMENGYPVVQNLDLAKLQVEVVRLYTLLKYGHLLQCLNPLFTDDHDLRLLDFSPGHVNFKGKGSEIEKMQLNPHLADTLRFVEHLRDGIFEDGNVPRVSVVGDVNANSAKELIVKWYPLLETYNELVDFYGVAEKKIFFGMCSLFGMDASGVGYNVRFTGDVLPDVGEQLEDLKFKLDNSILTIKDLVKRENPTLDSEGVDRVLLDNKRENAGNKPKLGGADASV